MIPAVRHQAILSALRRRGVLPVGDLALALQVSPSTLRRDLSLMEAEGLVRRTFGGAMLNGERDDPFDEVERTDAAAKRAIADAAAATVPDGATIILDIGTTCLAVAAALRGRALTVVTASLPVFEQFAHERNVRLHLLGGDYRSDYRCTFGNSTVEAIAEVRADVAFIGCSGVAADGTLRDTTLDQVAVKRAICRASDRTVLLASASKFPGKGSFAVLPLASLSHLITDAPLSGALEQQLEQSGTGVVRA